MRYDRNLDIIYGVGFQKIHALSSFIRYTTVTLLDKKKRLGKETCFTKAIFNNGLTRIAVETNKDLTKSFQ